MYKIYFYTILVILLVADPAKNMIGSEVSLERIKLWFRDSKLHYTDQRLLAQVKRTMTIVSEVSSSGDRWDKTNITCCGFGFGDLRDSTPTFLVLKKL